MANAEPLLQSTMVRRQSSLARIAAAFRAANSAVLHGADARALSFPSIGSLAPSKVLGMQGGGLSWLQVALTIPSNLSNAGALALPYSIATVGWAGLLIVGAASLGTALTGKMLMWTFDTLNQRKRVLPKQYLGDGFVCTYDQLAQELLGHSGGMLMQVLTLFECYGCVVCLLVLQRANWPAVFGFPPTAHSGWLEPLAIFVSRRSYGPEPYGPILRFACTNAPQSIPHVLPRPYA
jgi:hypothetical protein